MVAGAKLAGAIKLNLELIDRYVLDLVTLLGKSWVECAAKQQGGDAEARARDCTAALKELGHGNSQ